MNYVFLMGPLEQVLPKKDTSLALMVGAHRKNHSVFYLAKNGMIYKENKLFFRVTEVTPQYDPGTPFIRKNERILSQDEIDIVFIRTDPPFDAQYLQHTWLLDLLPKHIPVINAPGGIRTTNEKIWATRFQEVIPKTIIGSDRQTILKFLEEEQELIAKPTDSYGGQSIFHVRAGDRNTNVILETLTRHWQKDIIVQQYIPEARTGDKRILLLDGQPLGAVLRFHAEDDHRNNFFAGGKPQATQITENDKDIIALIAPELKKLGLYFVGIDIIGDYLIEVNVTSPTCLQEMNHLYQCALEDKVIEFSENLFDQLRSNNTIAP